MIIEIEENEKYSRFENIIFGGWGDCFHSTSPKRKSLYLINCSQKKKIKKIFKQKNKIGLSFAYFRLE